MSYFIEYLAHCNVTIDIKYFESLAVFVFQTEICERRTIFIGSSINQFIGWFLQSHLFIGRFLKSYHFIGWFLESYHFLVGFSNLIISLVGFSNLISYWLISPISSQVEDPI